jgi:hypothetical protein
MPLAWLLQHRGDPKLKMISLLESIVPAVRCFRSRLFRGVALLIATGALSASLLAQTNPTPTDPNANTNANGRQRRGGGNGGNGGNFDPAQAQERMLTNLREQFAVTDDAEWKLIADRITAVSDLRRATAAGGGFRGGQGGQGGGGGRGGRGAAASPEQDALRQAITDNLPDAEIKSRLAHLRDVRKANEEKLTKAQEELRAVLSVRQEAVAVMAGLLP